MHQPFCLTTICCQEPRPWVPEAQVASSTGLLGLTEPDLERTAPVLKPVPARKCYLLLKDKGVSYSVMSDSFDPMD